MSMANSEFFASIMSNLVIKPISKFIHDLFQIKKSHLTINFDYKDIINHFDYTKLAIELAGEVNIANESYKIMVTKQQDEPSVKYKMKINKISILRFTNIFSHRKFTDDESSDDVSWFFNATIFDSVVTGYTFINGAYELILKGDIKTLGKYSGKLPIVIVVKKEFGGPTKVAILIEMLEVKPPSLLTELTGESLEEVMYCFVIFTS